MEENTKTFQIRRASEKDRERINEFKRLHFNPYEPINVSLGILSGHTCISHTMSYLGEGRSLLAVQNIDEEDKIVGICLIKVNTSDEKPTDDPGRCVKFMKAEKLIRKLHGEADIWRRTGCDRAMNLDQIAVSSDMRRRGVAQTLIEHAIKMAVEEGFHLMRMTCSSSYSSALAMKMGMKCVAEIRYDEYVDDEGVQVIKPLAPHESVKTFIKVL